MFIIKNETYGLLIIEGRIRYSLDTIFVCALHIRNRGGNYGRIIQSQSGRTKVAESLG